MWLVIIIILEDGFLHGNIRIGEQKDEDVKLNIMQVRGLSRFFLLSYFVIINLFS